MALGVRLPGYFSALLASTISATVPLTVAAAMLVPLRLR